MKISAFSKKKKKRKKLPKIKLFPILSKTQGKNLKMLTQLFHVDIHVDLGHPYQPFQRKFRATF